MRSGILRDVVTIQQKTGAVESTYGGTAYTWATFAAGVRCRISPLSGRELLMAGAERSILKSRVRMRYLAGVVPAMRIVTESSEVHDIVSVVDVDNLHRELEILTSAVGS